MIETLRVFRRWLHRNELDPDDFDVVLVVKDRDVRFQTDAAIKASLPTREMVQWRAEESPRFCRGFPMTLEGTGVRIVTRDEVRPPPGAKHEVDAFQGIIDALKSAGYEVRSPRDNGYFQREME